MNSNQIIQGAKIIVQRLCLAVTLALTLWSEWNVFKRYNVKFGVIVILATRRMKSLETGDLPCPPPLRHETLPECSEHKPLHLLLWWSSCGRPSWLCSLTPFYALHTDHIISLIHIMLPTTQQRLMPCPCPLRAPKLCSVPLSWSSTCALTWPHPCTLPGSNLLLAG